MTHEILETLNLNHPYKRLKVKLITLNGMAPTKQDIEDYLTLELNAVELIISNYPVYVIKAHHLG